MERRRPAGKTRVPAGRRRSILLALCVGVVFNFQFSVFNPLAAQPVRFGLYGGVGVPGVRSESAPKVRTSYATGLSGEWRVESSGLWVRISVDYLRWITSGGPKFEALLDPKFYVKTYQFIPLTLGAGYEVGLCRWARAEVYGGVGAYWRYLHCQKMLMPMVVDNMDNTGWGLALKAGADVKVLQGHLSVGGYVLLLGNPWATGGTPVPRSTKEGDAVMLWRYPVVSGYGQCFAGLVVGYHF